MAHRTPFLHKVNRANEMVKIHLELEGRVDDVARALRRICAPAPDVGRSRAGPRITPEHHSLPKTVALTEPEATAPSAEGSLGRWTQELAAEFTACLDITSRRSCCTCGGLPKPAFIAASCASERS